MRIITLALASAIAFAPTFAFSQDTKSPETPAVSAPQTNNSSAPVAGKNSFTEEQAKERFEEAGYSQISDLKLTEAGIWEATAMNGANKVSVQLDYQGNVTKQAM
ncbi:PepSY domain-containing protein [Pseudochrobactrum kiredjianiae]|uniref:PepSY domain-containing protein n=1 Tax=Pseudochrobactrum kiredjianiae TaxID=386305 RepID=A0ABW3UYY7_9HYPH|nr:PepSY domain-containing protein [Pseudochrobactrum kiredjianiae]MDM7852467.1 PepSY domain-containing protein [Pseudochrobactrum kiredjianiae]